MLAPPQQARFASPTGQHLLSEIQRLQASNAKLNAKLAFAANRVPGLNRCGEQDLKRLLEMLVLIEFSFQVG